MNEPEGRVLSLARRVLAVRVMAVCALVGYTPSHAVTARDTHVRIMQGVLLMAFALRSGVFPLAR